MNKNESLSFLQSCIDRVKNATNDEVMKFKEVFRDVCLETEQKSSFEFILPTNEYSYEVINSFELNTNGNDINIFEKKEYKFVILGRESMNEQNDEIVYAA